MDQKPEKNKCRVYHQNVVIKGSGDDKICSKNSTHKLMVDALDIEGQLLTEVGFVILRVWIAGYCLPFKIQLWTGNGLANILVVLLQVFGMSGSSDCSIKKELKAVAVPVPASQGRQSKWRGNPVATRLPTGLTQPKWTTRPFSPPPSTYNGNDEFMSDRCCFRNEAMIGISCDKESDKRKRKKRRSLRSSVQDSRQSVCEEVPEKMSLPSNSSFQRAIGPILLAGQCFGLMPCHGILDTTPGTAHFKLWSFRTVYSLLILLSLVVVESICIEHMLLSLSAKSIGMLGGIGAATACFMFYGNALLGTINFFSLARKWPTLMASWNQMEIEVDKSMEAPPPISLKFSLLTALIMLVALGEHVLSVLKNVPVFLDHYYNAPISPTALPALASTSISHWTKALISTTTPMPVPSEPDAEGGFNKFLTEYCLNSHACIFKWVHYNTFYGIMIFIISKISTFTWNYTDLFLILLSTGLSQRYKQFNRALLRINYKEITEEEWGALRHYFAVLSTHTKKVDSLISGIVFASFGNNLYFICLQLLNGLNPTLTGLLDRIYFFYSFAFLLGRTVLVTLLAAQINFTSKEALCVLFNCPPKSYCTEAQRLQYQMTTDDISFSGMGFFTITRNFMLSVGAAIATYEIVLLQFNAMPQPSSNSTAVSLNDSAKS